MNLARGRGTQELPRRSDDDVCGIAAGDRLPWLHRPVLSGGRLAHPSHVVSRMTMLKLTDAQRAVLVQACPAVGHLAVGGLGFGQFLRVQPFSMRLAFVGMAIWFVAVAFAVIVAGAERWMNR